MRQAGVRLGRIFGIQVSADLGVLLIGGLLTWSLAAVILPQSAPGLATAAYWSVAVVGAVVFLASLLAHELSHSVIARRNGVEVEGITLWLFGGVAMLKNEARTPGAEFRIAIAGPLMSIALGVLFVGAGIGLGRLGLPELYVVLLQWLGLINGFLGVFNLLPGAPLDGGRVLGAIMWRLRGDRVAAKVTAAKVGRFVGLGLVGLGFVEVFATGNLGGLWTSFIGWFLMNAARMEEAHYAGQLALGRLPVGAAMAAHPEVTRAWTSVADVVEGPLRSTTQSAVPVLGFDGSVAGVVTMDQVRRVPAEHWQATEVGRIMIPRDHLVTASPEEPLIDALERLEPTSAGLLVVLSEGHLVGIVGPAEVQRAVELGRLQRRRRGRNGPPGTTVAPADTPRATPPPPPPQVPHQHWDPPLPSH